MNIYALLIQAFGKIQRRARYLANTKNQSNKCKINKEICRGNKNIDRIQ